MRGPVFLKLYANRRKIEAWQQTKKHSSAQSSRIFCYFGAHAPCWWSNAHLLLFSGQEGEHWSLLCAATGPPTTSPTSAAHPKLARASAGPRLLSPILFSRNNSVQTGASTPKLLLWISSCLTLHHPPTLQERGENSRPASRDRENRPPLFPLPLLSVNRGTLSTPPPPCNPQKLQNPPAFHFPSHDLF